MNDAASSDPVVIIEHVKKLLKLADWHNTHEEYAMVDLLMGQAWNLMARADYVAVSKGMDLDKLELKKYHDYVRWVTKQIHKHRKD